MKTRTEFRRLAEKVGRELLPARLQIEWDPLDFVREDASDILEIRVVDRTSEEPFFGVCAVAGQLLRSPHLEDAIRHELRGVIEKMAYAATQPERPEHE